MRKPLGVLRELRLHRYVLCKKLPSCMVKLHELGLHSWLISMGKKFQ